MRGARVSKVSFEMGSDPWSQTIIQFDGGQQLSAGFWRLIKEGQIEFTSFDFAPSRSPEKVNERIDSGTYLARELAGARLTSVLVDEATGDLWLELEPGLRLQALRLSLGFEEWELTCSPGLGEYSNYVLEP